MLNSRDIKKLRPDVQANCEKLLAMCEKQGLRVLITGTVRDDEYQRKCYKEGTANTPVPSFHGVKAGLAFDFCQNIKGHEYDDAGFFLNVATIAKKMGFSWGGDWKSFPDKPHLQWDARGKYTSAMIRAGKYPPNMEEFMNYEDWKKYMEQYRAEQGKKSVSAWAKEAWDKLTKRGVTDGSRPGDLITREEAAVMMDRMSK